VESESKVVLVTGASSGLGAAISLACAHAGYRVVMAARREERLRELEARIGRPEQTLAVTADVRELESIRAMVAAARERFGRIDALVANAGVGYWATFAESTEEQLLHQVEVNVLGVIRCAREVLPEMLARRSGHILTVSSVASEIPSPKSAIYAGTKGAVTAFSDALRREVQGQGVRVSTILPGFIESEMTERVTMKLPPASVMGNQVVALLRHPRRRAVVPRWYGGGIWLNRFLPRVMDHLIARMIDDVDRQRR
jgi:NADP-dependent 3-hydroxy acid dehydrogenase YdfG